MISIALADDHELIRQSIAGILQQQGFEIKGTFSNGKELLEYLNHHPVDVVLMDVNMPEKNGIETTQWLKKNKPDIKVIALSMLDHDLSVIRMIRAGARSYLIKNASIESLVKTIHEVVEKGYSISDSVSGRLMQSMSEEDRHSPGHLSERELEFLKLCCTEMTYKEIAVSMHVSPRTAEGYSQALCEKLDIKSRVGLVVYAFKHHLVEV